MQKIILASESERRKLLLNQAGIPFVAIAANIDEEAIYNSEVSPFDLVKMISTNKAMTVCEKVSDPCVIIAADTIISFHGKIMGKPKDKEMAFQMLKKLQGSAHSVYTGVTVIVKEDEGIKLKNIVETTTVYMRKLSEEEIQAYVNTEEPFDKAGAYAIQEKGSLLIEGIEGDYYNVVGLPLSKLYMTLKELNIDLTSVWA